MRSLSVILLIGLSLGICNAQTPSAKPVEPVAIGVIFHLDSAKQELKPLPFEKWKSKVQSAGFFTNATFITVSGEHSSFRLKANKKAEFVFITGSPEKVALYRFGPDGKTRMQYRIVSKDRWFIVEKNSSLDGTEPINGLPEEITKYGESSYMLVPASPLAPGEYAITIAGQMFTFGIDQ